MVKFKNLTCLLVDDNKDNTMMLKMLFQYVNIHSDVAYNGRSALDKIVNKKYDIILANINRNILLQDIPTYSNALHASGVLILSGFYKEDLPLIIEKCSENKLTFDSHLQKGKWIGAKFVF